VTAGVSVLSLNQVKVPEPEWLPVAERPVVGKDVLELLSSSMYVNPLSIYREYVQNSTDAIDAARTLSILNQDAAGRIDLEIDENRRTIRLRDNGIGLHHQDFVTRLIAFGSSKKRGTRARGFRGVGRLAGLGYCQELVFRSRAKGDDKVTELRWDCRNLKAALKSPDSDKNIEGLIASSVKSRQIGGREYPRRFFEVELHGIVRHRNDMLLNSGAVARYLAQVGPVPFAPDFEFGELIHNKLVPHVPLGEVAIHINQSSLPIYRPHRNVFEVRRGVNDKLRDVEFIEVPGNDGALAAVGWVLHHGYNGALPPSAGVGGLRLRIGNMQVGESNIVEELFPESRFNAWVVSEIHILDTRILPNGRRDHLEQNVHCQNLLDHLSSHANAWSRKCRTSSAQRNWTKQFQQNVNAIEQFAAILRQSATTKSKRIEIKEQIESRFQTLEKIATRSIVDETLRSDFQRRIKILRSKAQQLCKTRNLHRKLLKFKAGKRELATRIFDLIYELNKDSQAAKSLVERILRRI
jgi:Histidine kinase-, DNA gyrase B-, and HSP90-like ATPase